MFTQDSGKNSRNSYGNGTQPNIIAVQYVYIQVNVRCYSCNQFFHSASNFPDEYHGFQLMKYGLLFTRQAVYIGEIINLDWFLFDSCLIVRLVRNQYLLHSFNTCNTEYKLCVYTNGGYLYYSWMGTLKYLPLNVFNSPLVVVNILSLEYTTAKFRITMNTNTDHNMVFIINANNFLPFTEFYKGLHYLYTNNLPRNLLFLVIFNHGIHS